jgi:ssRNA-specific RNase YbeY (16S rRNA maturation enzyme)
MAAHLVHEWLHLIGFSHYQTFDFSVPYAVGDAVESIINRFPK